MTITAFDTNVTFSDVITLNGTLYDLTSATVLFLMRSAVGGPTFSDTAVIVAPQTSGLLIVGTQYKILTFNAGDNFLNVGAASNASGVIFTATGTTPTTWTNGSSLSTCTLTYQPGTNFPTNVGNYNQTWKITKGGKDFTFPGDAYNPVRIIENLAEA